jgi:hypothetical protein
MKYCKKCDQTKDLSEFHFKKQTKDGYAYYCKKCVSQYDKLEHLGIMALKALIKTNTHKQCRNCEKLTPIKEFETKGKYPTSYCKACFLYLKQESTFKKMGLTREKFESMVAEQGGVCIICKRPEKSGRRLSIDHDHSCCPSGRSCGNCVRGLICMKCNNALGAVNDDPNILLNMISYLQSYNYRLI